MLPSECFESAFVDCVRQIIPHMSCCVFRCVKDSLGELILELSYCLYIGCFGNADLGFICLRRKVYSSRLTFQP